jgi:hypothetical protein
MAQQGQEPRARLMIRQMVLENFKSYAGAQYVGPFHKVRPRGRAASAAGAHSRRCTPLRAARSVGRGAAPWLRPSAAHDLRAWLAPARRTSPPWWAPTGAASRT